jgi:hypothetical protein
MILFEPRRKRLQYKEGYTVNFTVQHIKLRFQVNRASGSDAETAVCGDLS